MSYLFLLYLFLLISVTLIVIKLCSASVIDLGADRIKLITLRVAFTVLCCRVSEGFLPLPSIRSDSLSASPLSLL
jgi:hypothetical protein